MTPRQPQKPRLEGGRGMGEHHWRHDAPCNGRRWGVILAGGDGVRLRGLTRLVCGDDRPKQFCPLLGNRTLLDDARQRAERSISPEQIVFSLTRHHRAHYLRDLGDAQRLVQPCNKGTAPAILSALLHIAQRDTDAIVAVLPSDHYYSQERIFTETLESAFAVAEAQPQSVVLLGARPTGPEVEYGWIEVGEAVPGLHPDALQVKGFREKPLLPIAECLLRSGSLWNTFVMVGYVQTFLEMASASVPRLLSVLRSTRMPPPCGGESRIPDWHYNQIAPTDFSHRILSSGASRLLALRLGDVEWSDLGDPDRVMHTLLQMNADLPAWAELWGTLRGQESPLRNVDRAAVA